MESSHLPLLVTISGSSANEPTQTSPKLPAFAMIRFALGAARTPETATTCGPGRVIAGDGDRAGLRTKGSRRLKADDHIDRIAGVDKKGVGKHARREEVRGSGDVEDRSGQVPELLIVSNSSANEPRQTFPKLPELAIAVAILAVPRMPVAVRSTNGAFGSFVMIRIVAISAPLARSA